jgi:tetratricopeptide (TPR) repeat protein
MPKTVVSIKATMRDHTIGVPAPENSVRFGIPNACNECHKDKPASWAVDRLNTWWPNGRRGRLVAQAEAFSAARAGRADAVDRLLAIGDDDRYGPLTRANAIGYLGNYSDPRAVSAVLRAARAPDPSIRITAVAALRQAGHDDIASRTAVRMGLSDPKRAVRIASLLTIIGQGGSDLSAGDLARYRYVAGEFAEWTGPNQHDPDLQRLQGVVHLLAGAFDRAAASLQVSLDLDPAAPSIKFFLGIARAGERRFDEARKLFEQVPRSDPYYEKAQEQLRKLP